MFPTRNGMMMCYAIRAYSITFNGMKKSSTKYLKVTFGYSRRLCYYDTNATDFETLKATTCIIGLRIFKSLYATDVH